MTILILNPNKQITDNQKLESELSMIVQTKDGKYNPNLLFIKFPYFNAKL